MKQPMIILGILVAGLGGWLAFAGQVRMETQGFDTLQRPPALFDHDTHNETAELEDCDTCHHVWENGQLRAGESSEGSPCSDCHPVKAGPLQPVSLANAFHTQCRSCHLDKGRGPLLCGQCHQNPDKGGAK